MKHIARNSGTGSVAPSRYQSSMTGKVNVPMDTVPTEALLFQDIGELSVEQQGTRIGLIDPYRFTRECLAKAFTLLHHEYAVRSFVAVKDTAAISREELDLLVYYSHDDGPSAEVILHDVAALRGAFPKTPIVVLSDATDAADPATIRSMFRHGAQGFIPTRCVGIPVAFAAIAFVRAGGKFAPLDFLLESQPEAMPPPPAVEPPCLECLTARQQLVFAHLRQGKANKIIAYELGVSESTVKVHIKNIMRKIGATNRTQAVYKAQAGWDASCPAHPAHG